MADLTATLAPPPGTILGETDYSLPGQISNSDNVRYVSGRVQPIGGWTIYKSGAGATGTATNALEWYKNDGTRMLAVAGTGGVLVNFGATLSSTEDIIYGGFSSATRWNLRNWGEYLLANPVGGTIYQWDAITGAASNLAALSNAPAVVNCMVVDPITRQVLAGNCTIAAGGVNPRAIRISDAEDNNDWTPTSSNLSDEVILYGQGGQIRAMEMIGSLVGVWTDSELFIGQATGDPTQPYRFELVGVGCGCLGKDAVTVADGVAYWINRDLRPMFYVLGSIPREVPGLPAHYITFELDLDKGGMTASYVWHNRRFNEIWFHPVVTNNTYPTTYIAVSVPSIGTNRPIWFPGTLSRSLMYQGLNDAFGMRASVTTLYQHEMGKQGETGTLLTWSFSMIVYIDKGKRAVMVKRVVPDIEDQSGSMTLTVSKLDYPQGAETTLQTKTVAVGDDRTDFRASGRLLRFQWSGNDGTGSTDTFARFGADTIEYVLKGGR